MDNEDQDPAQAVDTFTAPPGVSTPDPSTSSDIPPATTPPDAQQNDLTAVSKQKTRADEYTPSEHPEPALLAKRLATHWKTNTHSEEKMVKDDGERQEHATEDEHDTQDRQAGQKQEVDPQQQQTEQLERIDKEVRKLEDPDLAPPVRAEWFATLIASVGKSETPEVGGRERKPKPKADAGGK